MEIVENYTKVGDLALGFSHVLNITSSCVDLYKRQIVSNESSFNDFLIDYSKILKNVVKKSEIWTTFLVGKILIINSRRTFKPF